MARSDLVLTEISKYLKAATRHAKETTDPQQTMIIVHRLHLQTNKRYFSPDLNGEVFTRVCDNAGL